jgi:hypothetical protein
MAGSRRGEGSEEGKGRGGAGECPTYPKEQSLSKDTICKNGKIVLTHSGQTGEAAAIELPSETALNGPQNPRFSNIALINFGLV